MLKSLALLSAIEIIELYFKKGNSHYKFILFFQYLFVWILVLTFNDADIYYNLSLSRIVFVETLRGKIINILVEIMNQVSSVKKMHIIIIWNLSSWFFFLTVLLRNESWDC